VNAHVRHGPAHRPNIAAVQGADQHDPNIFQYVIHLPSPDFLSA